MLSLEPKIVFSIDANAYEQILNNIRFKAPLEIGVEIAVYMLLYGILDPEKYDVLDVSTMPKSNFVTYLSQNGKDTATLNKKGKKEADKTTDLVIVGKNFRYNDDSSSAYAFVEIKSLAGKKYDDEVKVQLNNTNHFIWTNGLKWIYRHNNERDIELVNLDDRKRFRGGYKVDKQKFKILLNKLNSIEWEK